MFDQPYTFSQIPGDPSFRNAAVNAVAVVPLLSQDPWKPATHSVHSFEQLTQALKRYNRIKSNRQGGSPTSKGTGAANSSIIGSSRGVSGSSSVAAGVDSSLSNRSDDLLLVVANSSLTRPGDWRYNETPLKGFHWQHGCQRLRLFDGRPEYSRWAHDRIMNSIVSRDWIDLCPSRRTAAVVGVLNLRDCQSLEDLHRAEEELHSWANRYATPPYEATAHGKVFERDTPVERLFVFDSFDELCQKNIDLTLSKMGTSILAFPPVENIEGGGGSEKTTMLDLHLNVVVHDLAVAVFRNLERKILDSDAICRTPLDQSSNSYQSRASQASSTVKNSLSKFIAGASTPKSQTSSGASASSQQTSGQGPDSGQPISRNLSLSNMATLVGPDSRLAKNSDSSPFTSFTDTITTTGRSGMGTASSVAQMAAAVTTNRGLPRSISTGGSASTNDSSHGGPVPMVGANSYHGGGHNNSTHGGSVDGALDTSALSSSNSANSAPKLLTPLDNYWELSDLSPRDMDAIRKRDMGRREKLAADLALLAGSPLDAYERYLKAAELCKTGSPDPLWYASALEGCAAAHIAMAEAGGYGVDEYLEHNFQMPDEIMALAKGRDDRQKSGSFNKQTLPEVVFALCDEALNITNRHPKLGPFHADLLLKLAYYVSESSEAHLRCRWGEGEGCYSGEADDIPRWQKPSVAKLKFGDLKTRDGMGDMVAINTFNRTKQVCDLLQEAVSVGSLDPATRVDVAARCARMCLDGVKATQWRKTNVARMRLPRKAAFFAVVAAEAMSENRTESAQATARDLWLLATQLFSKQGNPPDHGGDYGWACLRAITLNALAIQDSGPVASQAAEELLCLLSEAKFTAASSGTIGGGGSLQNSPVKRKQDAQGRQLRSIPESGAGLHIDRGETSAHDASSVGGEDYDSGKKSNFTRSLRQSFTTMTANSSILTLESKWADDPVIQSAEVPLSATSTAFPSVKAMGLVWKSVDAENCIAAQMRCMERISTIRRALPTSSILEEITFEGENIPLYVSTAITIQADPSLELEKVKIFVPVKKEPEHAMSTFYNPYDAKRNFRAVIPMVAQDEERCMSVEFGNRLSVPLEIQRCQLVFAGDAENKVKATPLSFTIPPKAKRFAVKFPFSVLLSGETDETLLFEVQGINVTFLGRSTILSLKGTGRREDESDIFPPLASTYPHLKKKKTKKPEEEEPTVKFETCSCQPRLQVHWAKTGAPIEQGTAIPILLADGELFSVPTIRLKNYAGPNGRGVVERLQILAVDIPGVPDKVLLDSDSADGCLLSEEEFTQDLMSLTNPPPVKVRVLGKNMMLDGINKGSDEHSLLNIQIAAAHNVKQLFKDGSTISIRFRYRGVPTATTEVWRKREISFRISCIEGPRVSSLDFRPDLSNDSSFILMCNSIRERAGLAGQPGAPAEPFSHEKVGQFDTLRVGVDEGFHVASQDCLFVLTVANETSTEFTLSREGGVGGFRSSPLQSIRVNSGVSAKFPVELGRIPRLNSDGTPVSLLDEIIKRTSFTWETRREEGASGISTEWAKGYLRVPRDALENIILQHPSFVSLICEPPCSIGISVDTGSNGSCGAEENGSDPSPSQATVSVGKAVTLHAECTASAWMASELKAKCSVKLEFFCARKEKALPGHHFAAKDFVWCGKLQQSFSMSDDAKQHTARVVFLNAGIYSVSACARIAHETASVGVEEIWWAPLAATVTVTPIRN